MSLDTEDFENYNGGAEVNASLSNQPSHSDLFGTRGEMDAVGNLPFL
jgi:hypothetical protein